MMAHTSCLLGCEEFVTAGAPVVVVTHASEKVDQFGRPSQRGKNLGHTALRAGFRQTTTFSKRGHNDFVITGEGNRSRGGIQIEARFGGEHDLDLEVVSVKSLAEVEEERKSRQKRKRDPQKGNDYAVAADRLIEINPTASKAEAGRLLADQFPDLAGGEDPGRTLANDLSRNRGIGGFLELVNGRWQRRDER